MTVKEILILCADISDRKDLATYLIEGSSDISPDTSFDAETLLKCYNITISEIATEYYRLKTIEKFTTIDGVFEYKNLQKNAFSVISVLDENHNKVDAKIYQTKLLTKIKTGYIEYEYIPKNQEIQDEFIFEKTPINSRIVALGVASEYLFVKGCFAESENYNRKFLNAVLSAISKSGKIIIPARKWF
jgi:hypothetical protein